MSPRYFGFVIGGSHPAAIAADWLVSTWDQNAGLLRRRPAVGVMEEVAGAWLVDLLGLPAHASVGFVTGCQMAHFTALAAARHQVLADVGWDVEADGLVGAPALRVSSGPTGTSPSTGRSATSASGWPRSRSSSATAAAASTPTAARHAGRTPGWPDDRVRPGGGREHGRHRPRGRHHEVAHEHGAWVHVDGAFGLWAAAVAEPPPPRGRGRATPTRGPRTRTSG